MKLIPLVAGGIILAVAFLMVAATVSQTILVQVIRNIIHNLLAAH